MNPEGSLSPAFNIPIQVKAIQPVTDALWLVEAASFVNEEAKGLLTEKSVWFWRNFLPISTVWDTPPAAATACICLTSSLALSGRLRLPALKQWATLCA